MLRTDSPAAPASLMFSGCLWHRWPHNHCWAHRGRGLIFKAFCSDDSLCIHEIDHSGLSVATCAPFPPQIWVVVACRARVLAAAPAESRRDGATAMETHQKVACGPLVIKAARGAKSNGGRGEKGWERERRSCRCHPNSLFIASSKL